jgi:hypothetical protein
VGTDFIKDHRIVPKVRSSTGTETAQVGGNRRIVHWPQAARMWLLERGSSTHNEFRLAARPLSGDQCVPAPY